MTIPESHLAFEAIAALVDGELSAGPAGRAARHLAGCADCRMAVQAQREAKDALHRCADVAVPGDLLSRLRAIPFTTDVPGSGSGLGSLAAGPDQLTMHGPGGSWAVPLSPARREDPHRWLRRGVAGGVALGLGLTALAVTLSVAESSDPATTPAVAPTSLTDEHPRGVPPVVRAVTVNTNTGSGGTP